MALIRATAVLPLLSGLPNDVVTNTVYFDTAAVTLEDAYDEISARISNAYGEIDDKLAVALSRVTGACSVVQYDMADPEPRIPVRTDTFTLGGASVATLLPTEVSLVLSYHADYESGVANARRRGRLYLGPWDGDQLGHRPPAALITACIAFADELATSVLEATVTWRQYSPTTGQDRGVVGGYVDDAWDTQRRRGYQASERTTWP